MKNTIKKLLFAGFFGVTVLLSFPSNAYSAGGVTISSSGLSGTFKAGDTFTVTSTITNTSGNEIEAGYFYEIKPSNSSQTAGDYFQKISGTCTAGGMTETLIFRTDGPVGALGVGTEAFMNLASGGKMNCTITMKVKTALPSENFSTSANVGAYDPYADKDYTASNYGQINAYVAPEPEPAPEPAPEPVVVPDTSKDETADDSSVKDEEETEEEVEDVSEEENKEGEVEGATEEATQDDEEDKSNKKIFFIIIPIVCLGSIIFVVMGILVVKRLLGKKKSKKVKGKK